MMFLRQDKTANWQSEAKQFYAGYITSQNRSPTKKRAFGPLRDFILITASLSLCVYSFKLGLTLRRLYPINSSGDNGGIQYLVKCNT